MDAKDRLRRYLEQRREMGESELVLDALPVDDLMSMLGAKQTRKNTRPANALPQELERQPREPAPRETTAPHVNDTPTPPVAPPPAPDVRFDSGSSTDWRATLRSVGASGTAGASGISGGSKNPSEKAPTNTPGSPPESTPGVASSSARTDQPMPAWLEALAIPAGLDVAAASVALPPEIAALRSIDDVASHVIGCTRCALYASAKKAVPGAGPSRADVMGIGEAPGQPEDEQGVPFAGEAGDLLTKILGAVHLTRDDIFLCNVLKHRTPGNRDPLPEELGACLPYLQQQIALVQPRVFLAMGRLAAQSLLKTDAPLSALRGKLHRYQGVPLIVTYHPAALLRNEAWKRPTWEDVKLLRRILDASRANAAPGNS